MINPDLPRYVANIPVRVEDDSDNNTSSGESSDETFDEKCFNCPTNHLRLAQKNKWETDEKPKTLRRGKIYSQRFTPSSSQNSATESSHFVFHQELLKKQLSEETFESSKRLKPVIGLNKMRSLSKSRNKSLPKAINDFALDSWKVFGFFWEGVYEYRSSSHEPWESLTFEKARKFYRQLKFVQGREVAKEFIEELEKKRGHQVPYRGIREAIRTSSQTKIAVNEFRRDNSNAPVYLASLDDDSVTLKAQDGRGVFSHYDALISNHRDMKRRELEMGSCGYLFALKRPGPRKKDLIIRLASEIDLWIRHETAQIFPLGIYYPEPSFIVRVPPGEQTTRYSFENPNDKDYNSPKESVMILDKLRQSFTDPNKVVAFNAEGAITTAIPKRAEKPFAAHFNREGKIVRWSKRDFQRMRGVSQSHYHPKKWASNLVEHFEIPSNKKVGNKNFKKGQIKLMVKSLLSRFFTHYDVFSIAKKKSENGSSFPKELIILLDGFDPDTFPDPLETRRKKPPLPMKKLDEIDSIKDLKRYLAKFLSQEDADNIERVVKNCSKKIIEILRGSLELDFPSLSLSLMQDYISELTRKDYGETKPNPRNNAVLENSILNERETIKTEYRDFLINNDARNNRDDFNATPLHWAAITGNRVFISALKKLHKIKKKNFKESRFSSSESKASREYKNISSFYSLHATTHGGAMPLHCALKYCIDNGIDLDLIRLLITKKSVNHKTKDGSSPLALAIKTGSIDLVEELIEAGAELTNNYDEKGNSLIMTAMESLSGKEKDDMIEYLCEDEELILQGHRNGEPPSALHAALDNRDNELFELFLDNITPSGFRMLHDNLIDDDSVLNWALQDKNAYAINLLINRNFINTDDLTTDEAKDIRKLTEREDIFSREEQEAESKQSYRDLLRMHRQMLKGTNINRECELADAEAILDIGIFKPACSSSDLYDDSEESCSDDSESIESPISSSVIDDY